MKILILTGKFGMGHLAAAKALAVQTQNSDLHAEVTLADLYEIAFPKRNEDIYRVYASLMSNAGKLINVAYKNAVHDDNGLPASLNPLQERIMKRLREYLLAVNPDVVITTYSLAARLVSDCRIRYGIRTRMITCVTDVGIHNVWLNPDTELYLVAAEATKASLQERGIPAEKIAVCGIPVAQQFTPAPVCKTHGNPFSLLVMGGGIGLLPADKKLFWQLGKLDGLQITVVCGSNRKLEKRLRAIAPANMAVYGYRNDVAQLMQSADMLLSKPGGISTFEAIHSHLPLLMFAPFLEQEHKNCNFVYQHGMGEVLPTESMAAAERIAEIVRNPQILDHYRSQMKQVCDTLDNDAIIRHLQKTAQVTSENGVIAS